VYIFLVAFVVPNTLVWGFIHLQALVMIGLYALGVFGSVLVAAVLNRLLPDTGGRGFTLELPEFKIPRWKNVLNSMWNKGRTFMTEAGKIIVIVSMVLWVLSSFGPGDERDAIRTKYADPAWTSAHSPEETQLLLESDLLHASYAGKIGGFIEPAIRPLGMDWRMGIALVTSFAAREVFVGTMSTIYSLGNDTDNIAELRENLQDQVDPKTGKPIMNSAVALSLLLFYVFALQCMSTVAIMRKETGGWKWPIIQFVVFGVLAYLSSFIGFQMLS
jgi:ferrous iron transport protein B